MHAPITDKLESGPSLVLTNPITDGIIAPPDTAMMIKPETSLALSGNLFKAKENMRGNIFPIPKPKINIDK